MGFYALLLFLVHFPPVQNYLLSIIEHRISKEVQGTVAIGSFRTNLIQSISFYNITGTGRNSTDSVYMSRLIGTFSLLPLLNRTVAIDVVGIDRGTVHLIRDTTGTLQFPLLPDVSKKGAEKKEAENNGWKIRIDSIFVNEITATYRDNMMNLVTTAQEIQGGIRVHGFDSLQGRISIRDGAVQSPWWNGTMDTLLLAGVLDDSLFSLQEFLLRGDSILITADGTVPLSTNASFALTARASGELGPFLPARSLLKGSVKVSLQARGTLQSPHLRAQMKSPFLRYGRYSADTLFATALYDSHHLALDLYAANETADLTLEWSTSVDNILTKPRLYGYNAVASANIHSISGLLKPFDNRISNVNGSGRLRLYVRGDSISVLPDSARIELAVIERGAPSIDSIKTIALLDNGNLNVSVLAGKGNTIRGSGTIRLPLSMQGIAKGNIDRPGQLSSLLLKEPVTGSLSFDGSFRGIPNDPFINAAIHSDTLAWRGLTLQRFDAGFTYDTAFYIEYARASVEADLGRISFAATESLRGLLTAHIAARGTLQNPEIKADAVVVDPVYSGYRADRIASELTISNETIFWDSLILIKDTVQVFSSGKLNYRAPRRSMDALVKAQIRNKPALHVQLTGNLIGDSATLTAAIEHIIPGRLLPSVPAYTCLEGSMEVKTHLRKQQCIRGGSLAFNLMLHTPFLDDTRNVNGEFLYKNGDLDGSVLLSSDQETGSPLRAMVHAGLRFPCAQQPLRFEEGSRISLQMNDFAYGELVRAVLPGFYSAGELSGEMLTVFRNGSWHLDGTAHINADSLAYTPAALRAEAAVMTLSLQGTLSEPAVQYRLSGQQITYTGQPVMNLYATGSITPQILRIDSMSGNFGRGDHITGSGMLPLQPVTISRLDLVIRNLPLPLANPFIPVPFTGGTLSGNLSVSGGKPYYSRGRITIDNVHFSLPQCDAPIGPVDAIVLLRNDSILLEDFTARVDRGRIRGSGFAGVSLPAIKDFNLQFQAEKIRLNCEGLAELGIDNANIRYVKTDDQYRLTATISLDNTRVDQVVTIPEIAGLFFGRGGAGQIPELFRSTSLDATLRLNRNLLIDTNLGRLLLDGRLAIRGTLMNPRFNGVLQVAEGQIVYLDREFEIEDGTLRQFSPSEINPSVDITATTTMRGLTFGDPADYTITLAIRGTLRQPEITLASSPPLEQIEILNLLTLGSTQGGSGLGARTGEIASAQLSGIGSQFLEQALGVDNIQISGNLFTILQNGGLTLTVTEDLTSSLILVYQTDVTNLANQQAQLLYRLTPQLHLLAGSSTSGESELGIRFTIRK
jgi:hypothetical protein